MIGKKLKNLQDLTLNSTSITGKGFVFLAENLSKLQKLNVCKCLISDKALIEGAMSLGNLDNLVFGCERISDKGLEKAVPYLTGLIQLTLYSSNRVTLKGLEIIVNGLPNLNYLMIGKCRQLPSALVTPRLERIGLEFLAF